MLPFSIQCQDAINYSFWTHGHKRAELGTSQLHAELCKLGKQALITPERALQSTYSRLKYSQITNKFIFESQTLNVVCDYFNTT